MGLKSMCIGTIVSEAAGDAFVEYLVLRCKTHGIVDCFDCKNPVQSTQENPEFEEVEVPNGHE